MLNVNVKKSPAASNQSYVSLGAIPKRAWQDTVDGSRPSHTLSGNSQNVPVPVVSEEDTAKKGL